MTQKLIAQGAEAKIIITKEGIVKDRITDGYRIKELDEAIRKQRTKAETKLLTKASKIIPVPLPEISKDKTKISLPFLRGQKLSKHLDNLKNNISICKQIGIQIALLHDAEIIHGDLTTSNMILVKDKVFFIDFGLGFISRKFEDKAVDIHLLKQALEAKHYKHWESFWKAVESGYKKSKSSKLVLERLKAVERRGRYKH